MMKDHPSKAPTEAAALAPKGDAPAGAAEPDGHTPVSMRLFVGKLPDGVSETELK
jgi:hypothetical protein